MRISDWSSDVCSSDLAASKGSRTGVLASPAYYRLPDDGGFGSATIRQPVAAVDRSKLPEVGNIPDLDFPAVETTTLSNGIKVHFARRDAIPAVQLSVVFDAGNAADPKDKLGTQALMLAMLKEEIGRESCRERVCKYV